MGDHELLTMGLEGDMPRLVWAIVLVGLVGGCADGGAESSTTISTLATASSSTVSQASSTSTTAVQSVLSAWEPIDTGGRVLQAWLTVPLDHDDPQGEAIDVPVWIRPASDPDKRIGVLLVNPGGPGVPARYMVEEASVFTEELRSFFDIVALEPRGTFAETEVDCFADPTQFESAADWSPETPEEIEALDVLTQSLVAECAEKYGHLLEHVSTMDTVHDMALLARALGEEQVSYYGVSYGSLLGAAFVATYPELIRAAVFDAAFMPYTSENLLASELVQAEANEAFILRLIETCDNSPDCPIEGDTLEAFQRVSQAADKDPFDDYDFLPTVNQNAFGMVLFRSDFAYGWGTPTRLLEAVAAADGGNGVPLQREYADRVEWASFFRSDEAIYCMDYPHRGASPWPEETQAQVEQAAPTIHAIFPNPEGFDSYASPWICDRWPAGPDLLPDPLTAAGPGPVLVVTATGDPLTPLESARALAEEVGSESLLIVESDRHGSYDSITKTGSAHECATEHIDQFLITLDTPTNRTVCES